MSGWAVGTPEAYCPICGVKLTTGHACKQSTLNAIDAAHKRDPDSILLRKIPKWKRFVDGVLMLRMSGDFD